MSFPARIGRYEIVAELASGGMAEILLARLVGPNGFERPVVIKRILPHLAREPAFVDMFLDEARIVAGIRHPNVVQVQELGHDGGELFLAMELLEGESVSGLMKRLHARGERLPPLLAAHLVAQACAGLHAAHELTDAGGKPLHLVHRDVSPQNLLVTYAGQVKVLDFGVAKAADRITRTETGIVKGKHEYMAPEQCLGKPLDRRCDVFALGVVLYELLAGARLFKRDNQMAAFQAICIEPLVPLSAAAPWVDPLLERVCARALARDPGDRFATAAAMRRELLEAMQALGGAADPDDEVAALMRRLFSERIAQKAEMLRAVRAGTAPGVVPRSEADLAVDMPSVAGTLAASVGMTGKASGAERPRRRARVGAAMGVAAVLAAAVLVGMRVARYAGAGAGASAGAGGGALAVRFDDLHRISFGDACEEFPSITPDGKLVVFDATEGSDSHIAVMELDGGKTRALTDVRGWDYGAALSPDGRRVAFTREVGGRVTAMIVALEGGEPRPVRDGVSKVAWARDSASIWLGELGVVQRFDAATGALLETVPAVNGYFATNPLELPDGALLLRLAQRDELTMSRTGLWLIPADRSPGRWLYDRQVEEAYAPWPDGKRVIFAHLNAGEQTELLTVLLDGSSPAVAVNAAGISPWKGLAVTPDGQRLVWSTCHAHGDIVRRDHGAWTPILQGGEWSDSDLSWVRGTRQLVVLSTRSGRRRPWVLDLDGRTTPRLIGDTVDRDADPETIDPRGLAVSPDGRFLALSGVPGVGVVDLRAPGGTPPTVLTSDPTDYCTGVSRDGRTVTFTRPSREGPRAMAVPAGGGEARPLLGRDTRCVAASPVEDRIAFMQGPGEASLTPMLADLDGAHARPLSAQLAPGAYGAPHFSHDGKRVAFIVGGQEIVEVDVATGALTHIATEGGASAVEYTDDGMYAATARWRGNLWMASVVGAGR